jgi:hypothetical protein
VVQEVIAEGRSASARHFKEAAVQVLTQACHPPA